MQLGSYRYRLNPELSGAGTVILLFVGLAVAMVVIFFSVGYTAVQFLGITPAIVATSAFNYYMNVGASGTMLILFFSILSYLLYQGIRKISKKPSALYSWLIIREMLPNEDKDL